MTMTLFHVIKTFSRFFLFVVNKHNRHSTHVSLLSFVCFVRFVPFEKQKKIWAVHILMNLEISNDTWFGFSWVLWISRIDKHLPEIVEREKTFQWFRLISFSLSQTLFQDLLLRIFQIFKHAWKTLAAQHSKS